LRAYSSHDMLLLGRIIRPHGLEGVLRVQSYASSKDSFLEGGSVLLRRSGGDIREYGVVAVAAHKGIVLMKLEGIDSVEEAEKYRGADIVVEKQSVPLQEEEFLWEELLGLDVYLATGEQVGRLSQIIPTKGNDIYVIKGEKKEILIPAVHEVIKEIDIEEGRITISPMEGLLDLNEI